MIQTEQYKHHTFDNSYATIHYLTQGDPRSLRPERPPEAGEVRLLLGRRGGPGRDPRPERPPEAREVPREVARRPPAVGREAQERVHLPAVHGAHRRERRRQQQGRGQLGGAAEIVGQLPGARRVDGGREVLQGGGGDGRHGGGPGPTLQPRRARRGR